MIAFLTACKRGSVVLCLFLLSSGVPSLRARPAGAALAVIPQPAKVELRPGAFRFSPKTRIYLETGNRRARWVAEDLSKLLSGLMGRAVPVISAKPSAPERQAIVFSLKAPAALGPDGYRMAVSRGAIRISAPKAAGLFYALQTLRQMLPPAPGAPVKAPLRVQCVRIQDRPRFRWRGLMLDCSRTFLSMEYLRHSVDLMALYKLNVLHLHLTDDQGWRLAIRQYPKLTTVGAHYAERFGGAGGFYTQQQMRELIAYAKKRNITVVPEIEMPGHSGEVLAAYPELACPLPGENRTFEVTPFWQRPAHFSEPLCVCNDQVFEMYRNILSSVINLFPSEFIHVGGDEVPKQAWNESSLCQARMKAEGLKNADELQSHFMKRIEKVIAAKGRRMIGWDEILEGGLAPGAAVESWRGAKGGLAAAQLGHDVVMAPNPYTYFDFTYHSTPIEKVYSYDPAEGFTPAMAKHILGVEGCMWTHIAVTDKAIDYQIYPRLLALAEVGWSPERDRNWPGFDARMLRQFSRLRSLGVTYHDPRATGAEVGAWSESDLSGDAPRVFNWDATSLIGNAPEAQVQVRLESGNGPVYVRSFELLKDGKEAGEAVFAGPLNKRNDVEVSWLSPGARHPGCRYTLRVTLQGSMKGSSAGSVWIMKPPHSPAEAARP